MPDAINAAAIPGAELRPDMVEIAAAELAKIGDKVGTQAATVVTTWQRLSASYDAPEDTTLFGVMDPVKTNGETFDANMGLVSSALQVYAAEVEPIKAELARIKLDAYAFLTDIAGGVEQRSANRMGDPTTKTVEWHEDGKTVAANNALIGRVNDQMELLWAAERKCANAIYDIIGFPHIRAATDANPNGYRVEDIPEGAETPWGTTVERTESCGERVANGIVIDGIGGTLVGLGTLTLGYNPQTGEWFSGDAYAAGWSNLGMLAVGLSTAGLVTTPLIMTMPGPVGDFLRRGQETLLNAGKGLIAYDTWKEDPARAAGATVFNLGTLIIPVGAATAPVRTSASTAAAAIRASARVVNALDPLTLVGRGGSAAIRITMPAVSDALRAFDFGDMGTRIDLPDLPPTRNLDIPTVSRPDMTVDTPRVDGDLDVPIRTPEDAVSVPPVREPELVGAGGRGGGGGAGGGADLPGSGSAGGGGTGGDGMLTPGQGGTPWDPEMGDPTLSPADHGPDFVRDQTNRGNPVDPDYGQPNPNHGTLNPTYAPPPLSQIPAEVRELVNDPEAPFGRGADGQPYSQAEWEARYLDQNGRPVYPGNDGAVPGRRVDFSSVDEFTAHYGDVLDRMGGRRGDFTSFPDTPFEARALPGSNLSQPYLTMRLTGDLPPNTRIEVSEVAPAFGQPGGGLQVRVIEVADDGSIRALSVDEMQRRGIADVVGDTSRSAPNTPVDDQPNIHYSDRWEQPDTDGGNGDGATGGDGPDGNGDDPCGSAAPSTDPTSDPDPDSGGGVADPDGGPRDDAGGSDQANDGRLTSAGADDGLPPTPETIRTGMVRMENHPDYASIVTHLKEREFHVRNAEGRTPHVSITHVHDGKLGEVIRIEKYVNVVPGMRFLDLEHEVGHVHQLTERFSDDPPATEHTYFDEGRERRTSHFPVLKEAQDDVAEYHVRLEEYLRLQGRGVPDDVLDQHRRGLLLQSEAYGERTFRPEVRSWRDQHFSDISALEEKVRALGVDLSVTRFRRRG